MYELCPYFTNDGTVGLFSPQDDDIYHSTYGALTESWQKFIIPSHLQEFVKNSESVRILDICYGIGYNTKAALNVFINNYFEFSKNKKNILKKNNKKNNSFKHNIAPIGTDNNFKVSNNEIIENPKENRINNSISSEAIDADNVLDKKNESQSKTYCKKILIDAIDTDNILIELSPFIKTNSKKHFNTWMRGSNNKKIENKKFSQVKRIQSSKKFNLKNEYKLRTEVAIIILEQLQKNRAQNNNIISKTTTEILRDKKFVQYWSKFMLNLSSFYQNKGYNYNKCSNKMAFLHNIYYRYISRSYKKANELLKNLQIGLNFHNIDARGFVSSASGFYDFIFLDAFTPAKCPSLWSVNFFNKLYSLLDTNGLILTYSNSAAVRNAFLQNGFYVGKIYDSSTKKFVGTVAAKLENLIEHKLSEYDIGLINSKAGICYRDKNLNLENSVIIENRNIEVSQSDLLSSSKYIKGAKNV